MTDPQWKQEFPGFEMPDMDLPEGFKDTSWHNDACPSFTDENRKLRLYVNYADPQDREFEELPRFLLVRFDDDHSEEDEIAGGEKWEDVASFVVEWPVDRFDRLPITEVTDADLQAAADTYRSWARQIECGNNFVYASGQAGALADYKAKQYRAEAEIERRACERIREEEEQEEARANGWPGHGF